MSKNRRSAPMMMEKPKNFKKSFIDLFGYCKGNYFAIIVAIIFAIGGTVLALVSPNKIGDLTNIIAEGMVLGVDMNRFMQIVIFLIIIYVASALFSYVQQFIMVVVTQKISKKMRSDISTKINRLPLKFLDSTSHGDILSRITNDVDTISQTLNNSIASLVGSIALFFGCLIMMFVKNWILALSAIGATIIGFGIMGIIVSKSQKYFAIQQASLGELNGHIEETYTSHNVVKAYNGGDAVKSTFKTINNKLYTSVWKSQFLSGLMMPLMNFVGNFGFVVVCVVGAVLCSNGKIDIGVIISFMIYVRLFTQPLSNIAQSLTTLQSTAAASERVFEILHQPEQTDESNKTIVIDPENIVGNVEFKNVKFGYNEDKIIIPNFSARIKAGEKVAIVGPTGAGKTTLVNLLMRFYEVKGGEILIDGVSSKDLTRTNIHDIFGMVLQDTWLFEGTIKENIVYNKPNVTDEQVEEVCKNVGIDHFIRTLSNGYNTVLNETVTISAGQKQLLTIARAMIQNSPMLILDEATSSVDTRTEIQIQKAMDKLTEKRTSFVIAHRLSTIKNADLILVMKDGNVIEQGNHKELMKLNGFYANLYNSQFTNSGAAITE